MSDDNEQLTENTVKLQQILYEISQELDISLNKVGDIARLSYIIRDSKRTSNSDNILSIREPLFNLGLLHLGRFSGTIPYMNAIHGRSLELSPEFFRRCNFSIISSEMAYPNRFSFNVLGRKINTRKIEDGYLICHDNYEDARFFEIVKKGERHSCKYDTTGFCLLNYFDIKTKSITEDEFKESLDSYFMENNELYSQYSDMILNRISDIMKAINGSEDLIYKPSDFGNNGSIA